MGALGGERLIGFTGGEKYTPQLSLNFCQDFTLSELSKEWQIAKRCLRWLRGCERVGRRKQRTVSTNRRTARRLHCSESKSENKPRPQPEAISSRTKGDHRLAVRKYMHLASWTLFELVAMEPWKVHVVYGSYVCAVYLTYYSTVAAPIIFFLRVLRRFDLD